MFIATAIPSVLFLVATLLIPESPRWLATVGREKKARYVLERLGGSDYATQVLQEFSQSSQKGQGDSILSAFASPGILRALILGIALAVLQQWCGINVVFNYAQEIFAEAGYQVSGILFNIVVTGTVNLAFTFVALFTIDRYGRRFLLLRGTSGLAIIYIILGACYHYHVKGVAMLLLVLAAIACYAMSLAPATWVVISEIFPNRIRSSAMSIAITALWTACFLLTYTFPFLNAALGASGTFWIYAAICIAGYMYLRASLPESKGKSLEEIEVRLRAGTLMEKSHGK
jgi:SP family sugar porter-like MFS transporter